MNTKIIAAVVGAAIAVAIPVYLASLPAEEVPVIHGAGLMNADKCIDGEFTADPSQEVVEVSMKAYQWRFSYCTITVHQGQTVVLTLESLDTPHGFAIDGYPEVGNKHISPNAETVVRFTADKAGRFTYYCTVFCGEGHPLHLGKLVVLAA